MSTKNSIIPHEYWVKSDPIFILMKEGIYSGIRKRIVSREALSSREALIIWNADWESEEERMARLCEFGGRKFFRTVRRLVFEELLYD